MAPAQSARLRPPADPHLRFGDRAVQAGPADGCDAEAMAAGADPVAPGRAAVAPRSLQHRLRQTAVFESAPKWIRTTGLSLRRGPLYPAELSGLGRNCGLVGGFVAKKFQSARHTCAFLRHVLLHENEPTAERATHAV
jgi:hypothetical protein